MRPSLPQKQRILQTRSSYSQVTARTTKQSTVPRDAFRSGSFPVAAQHGLRIIYEFA